MRLDHAHFLQDVARPGNATALRSQLAADLARPGHDRIPGGGAKARQRACGHAYLLDLFDSRQAKQQANELDHDTQQAYSLARRRSL